MTIIISPLKLSDVLQYSMDLVKTIVKPRTLNLSPGNYMSYETDFRIPAGTFAEWQKAIGNLDSRDNRNMLYAYLNTNAFFTCTSRLGIDFKTILHLSTSVDYQDLCFQFEPDSTYHYKARVKDIKPFPGVGRAILELETQIFDKGEVKLVQVDRMFFRGIPTAVYEKMVSQREPDTKYAGISRRGSKLAMNYEAKTSFHVGRKLGMQYGMLSGDLNPLHTVNLVSKLFKHPGSFVQGLCATNLVLALLKDRHGLDVKNLDITFASPLFAGHNYYLVVSDNNFEVLDAHDQVKIFGEFEDGTHLRKLMGRKLYAVG